MIAELLSEHLLNLKMKGTVALNLFIPDQIPSDLLLYPHIAHFLYGENAPSHKLVIVQRGHVAIRLNCDHVR